MSSNVGKHDFKTYINNIRNFTLITYGLSLLSGWYTDIVIKKIYVYISAVVLALFTVFTLHLRKINIIVTNVKLTQKEIISILCRSITMSIIFKSIIGSEIVYDIYKPSLILAIKIIETFAGTNLKSKLYMLAEATVAQFRTLGYFDPFALWELDDMTLNEMDSTV